MIDTMNHGRVSQALFIYKTATRHFIARTLKSQNGGAGDWFADLVLPNLSGPIAERLKDRVREAAEEGSIASRGGQDDEGPERFFEESHFPRIVAGNWDAFRHSLKDRDMVLKQLRQVKRYRDDKVAHNSQPVSDEEVTDIIRTCQAIIRPFDSSAADQLAELLTPPQAEDESSDSVSENGLRGVEPDMTNPGPDSPTPAEAKGGAMLECSASDDGDSADPIEEVALGNEDEGAWARAKMFEEERRRRTARLDKLIHQFVQAGEAYNQIEEIKDTLNDLGSTSDADFDDTWNELHSLRWRYILPELVAEVIEASSGFATSEGARGGEVEFDAEGSNEWVDLKISLEVRDR